MVEFMSDRGRDVVFHVASDDHISLGYTNRCAERGAVAEMAIPQMDTPDLSGRSLAALLFYSMSDLRELHSALGQFLNSEMAGTVAPHLSDEARPVVPGPLRAVRPDFSISVISSGRAAGLPHPGDVVDFFSRKPHTTKQT